mmetsp:Transcript_24864/g.74713  ORF Transcript_24864/g.74713 Transcript_24864/m.74713 type:complete len:104 (-) Transcript_24864:104-415(-)
MTPLQLGSACSKTALDSRRCLRRFRGWSKFVACTIPVQLAYRRNSEFGLNSMPEFMKHGVNSLRKAFVLTLDLGIGRAHLFSICSRAIRCNCADLGTAGHAAT